MTHSNRPTCWLKKSGVSALLQFFPVGILRLWTQALRLGSLGAWSWLPWIDGASSCMGRVLTRGLVAWLTWIGKQGTNRPRCLRWMNRPCGSMLGFGSILGFGAVFYMIWLLGIKTPKCRSAILLAMDLGWLTSQILHYQSALCVCFAAAPCHSSLHAHLHWHSMMWDGSNTWWIRLPFLVLAWKHWWLLLSCWQPYSAGPFLQFWPCAGPW